MNFEYCNMIVVPIPKLLRCARSPDCAKLLRLRGACPGLGSNCKRRQSLSLWYSKGKIVLHLFLGLVWDILHMFWDASQIIGNCFGLIKLARFGVCGAANAAKAKLYYTFFGISLGQTLYILGRIPNHRKLFGIDPASLGLGSNGKRRQSPSLWCRKDSDKDKRLVRHSLRV